jgi:optic atrophy protein 1
MLRVIQLNILEDRSVNDKREWDQAVRFLETSVKEKLQSTEQILRDMLGPNRKDRWLYWQFQTEEQEKRTAVKSELDKILYADKVYEINFNKTKFFHFFLLQLCFIFLIVETCAYSYT